MRRSRDSSRETIASPIPKTLATWPYSSPPCLYAATMGSRRASGGGSGIPRADQTSSINAARASCKMPSATLNNVPGLCRLCSAFAETRNALRRSAIRQTKFSTLSAAIGAILLVAIGCEHRVAGPRTHTKNEAAKNGAPVRVVDLMPTRAGLPVTNLASAGEVDEARKEPVLASFSFTALPHGGRGFVEWRAGSLLCGDFPRARYGVPLAVDTNNLVALGPALRRMSQLDLDIDAAERGDADVPRETWLIVAAHESGGESWPARVEQSKRDGVSIAHRLLEAGAFDPPLVVTVVRAPEAEGAITFGSYPAGDATALSERLPVVRKGPPPDPRHAESLFRVLVQGPLGNFIINDGLPVEVHLGEHHARYNASIVAIEPDKHHELRSALQAVLRAGDLGCRLDAAEP